MTNYFLILIILISSCNSQITKQTDMETFDVKEYNENKNLVDLHIYELENGNKIEDQGGYEDGTFTRKIIYPNSLIQTYIEFSKVGTIMKKGDFYSNDFNEGIWETYNENGEVIETIDYNRNFKFTWKDVQNFCLKKEIDIKLYSTSIAKDKEDELVVWKVMWLHNPSEFKIFVLNGTNGNVIREEFSKVSFK